MPDYLLSPYVHPIESHLDPENIRYAVFHQLTGRVFEPPAVVLNLLSTARAGARMRFEREQLLNMREVGMIVLDLIDHQFLVIEGTDPFESFLDYYPVRPIQNPAITYQSDDGDLIAVRMSMLQRICSPTRGDLEEVIEETLPSLPAGILISSDGSNTLRQLLERFDVPIDEGKGVVEFLSDPERQLIKLTQHAVDLDNPIQPFNTVPRSLHHSAKWEPSASNDVSSISEFHQQGIQDANWEFDVIEPTVNHSLRFPSEILGGRSYGAQFSAKTLTADVLGERATGVLNVLEVGGGTGTFACSFLKQAREHSEWTLNYHLLELSPALAANQKKLLTADGLEVEHFIQDAVSFSIPDRKFDLIIANEVIADFPVSAVQRRDEPDDGWAGDGAIYLEKYGLPIHDAPASFKINSGVFEFIERAWEHLQPGGTAILTEYGFVDGFPVQILHLNHEEFSIHFGHVKACAERVGFSCRLLSLIEFLQIDEQIPVVAGTDQHIICLNHVLKRFNQSLPFAAITKSDFEAKFQTAFEATNASGVRFISLQHGYHYGPPLNEFMVLIMDKPS
ncbi:MAG TPA: SAM-dependent methyltransferase [Pyrinomonadaceae bacterium]|nr:SAM-dependent methyltransferase [Pyrinomonadaceae bacterium]